MIHSIKTVCVKRLRLTHELSSWLIHKKLQPHAIVTHHIHWGSRLGTLLLILKLTVPFIAASLCRFRDVTRYIIVASLCRSKLGSVHGSFRWHTTIALHGWWTADIVFKRLCHFHLANAHRYGTVTVAVCTIVRIELVSSTPRGRLSKKIFRAIEFRIQRRRCPWLTAIVCARKNRIVIVLVGVFFFFEHVSFVQLIAIIKATDFVHQRPRQGLDFFFPAALIPFKAGRVVWTWNVRSLHENRYGWIQHEKNDRRLLAILFPGTTQYGTVLSSTAELHLRKIVGQPAASNRKFHKWPCRPLVRCCTRNFSNMKKWFWVFCLLSFWCI